MESASSTEPTRDEECPHLSDIAEPPAEGCCLSEGCRYQGCVGHTEMTLGKFTCLTCYKAYCFIDPIGHVVKHTTETGHRIMLCSSQVPIFVWCMACKKKVYCKDIMNKLHKTFERGFRRRYPWARVPLPLPTVDYVPVITELDPNIDQN